VCTSVDPHLTGRGKRRGTKSCRRNGTSPHWKKGQTRVVRKGKKRLKKPKTRLPGWEGEIEKFRKKKPLVKKKVTRGGGPRGGRETKTCSFYGGEHVPKTQSLGVDRQTPGAREKGETLEKLGGGGNCGTTRGMASLKLPGVPCRGKSDE